jgi:predicted secreted protein
MSITSGLVLFSVLWFLSLLMLLPIGVKSQAEAGEVEPGTPAGAPDEPMIRKKMLWATGLSAVLWLILYGIIVGGVITREDLRVLSPF